MFLSNGSQGCVVRAASGCVILDWKGSAPSGEKLLLSWSTFYLRIIEILGWKGP